MAEAHVHRYATTMDSIPPAHFCDCGQSMPLTEHDKREYKECTGHDYVERTKR